MTDANEDSAVQTGEKPTPTVLSINICDSIIRDETTKKVSLIGLFNTITSNSFPCTHPLLHVYIALSNGHGKYKTEIRFSNLADDKPIAEMLGELVFQNPLQVIEMNVCWQRLIFEKPGEYVVEVLCEATQVGARKFTVMGPQRRILPTSGTEVG